MGSGAKLVPILSMKCALCLESFEKSFFEGFLTPLKSCLKAISNQYLRVFVNYILAVLA